jgi:hypothetical protein
VKKVAVFIMLYSVLALSCGALRLGTGLPNGAEDDLACLPDVSGGEVRTVLRGTTASPYGFKIFLPEGCEDGACSFPLLIYLHGSGANEDPAIGPESVRDLYGGPLNMIADGNAKPRYPLIVASPQYTVDDGSWVPEHLRLFIAYLKSAYNVNPKRVYLTGFSMGGYGTFSYIASEFGDDIAAAVPIAGSSWVQASLMGRVPTWVFYGKLDSYERAVSLVEDINAARPKVRAKITLFPELGHTGVWEVYAGPGLAETDPESAPFVMNIFDWMFQYSRP